MPVCLLLRRPGGIAACAAILALLIIAAHLCHNDITWAEEALPMAAAAQMEHGKALYLEIWFDKPPLLAWAYLLPGMQPGWTLRLGGAFYTLLAGWIAYRFAREAWGPREGLWSAGLLGFFLTFGVASAVLPVAADLMMLAPHLAAVHLAWKRRAFWSGVCAGMAFLINPKGLFVGAACLIWCWRSLPLFAIGAASLPAVAAGILLYQGSASSCYEQVWRWGRVYASESFYANPLLQGIVRTASWAWFHAALVLAAFCFWRRERGGERWRWAGWLAISLAATAAGGRFFPRYYFQILPPMVMAAARGFSLLPPRRAALVSLLLLIPLVRFGPRYVILASESLTGAPHRWADVAMDRDSREVARLTRALAKPGDTLFVWGFRPELYLYTGLPAANRFLDSQPLTGVPADRHLTQSAPVRADFTRTNREELARSQPSFILDGLGLYNPHLAMTVFPDLRAWLASYREAARSGQTVIYVRSASPAAAATP